MWINVYNNLGFGRAGLNFWDELPGWLGLPGPRLQEIGGLGGEKISRVISIFNLMRETKTTSEFQATQPDIFPTLQSN